MPTQAEIIAGARALLEDEAINKLLHRNCTDWQATRTARAIVKMILEVAEKMRSNKIKGKSL